MRRIGIVIGLLAAAAVFPVWAADPPPQEIKEGDVLRLNEAMTPGPMHQLLARFSGSWTYQSSVWLTADSPPASSNGTAEKKMILGGRYLEEIHQGTFLGAPTEGRNLTGWDNLGKELQGVWVDNGGTAMLFTRGRLEADGKTLTFEAEHKNPLTERRDRLRLIYRIEDDDHHVFEYWVLASKGQPERKQSEVRYTRLSGKR